MESTNKQKGDSLLGMHSINYWLYRIRYIYGRHLNLKAPADLSLELSSSCDLACVFCYHADPKKLPFKKGLMNFDLASKCLMEGAEIGISSFKGNFRGESTLHPKFKDITALAKSLANGSTYMERITNTNMNFSKNRTNILEGLCNQTKVKASIDSLRKDVLEKQRFKSKYEIIMKNMDDLYNHPLRKNTEIVVQAVRTQSNKDEDLETEVKKRWPEATVRVNNMVSGRVDKDLDSLEVKKRDFNNRQPCVQAFSRLIVRWDGGVQSCCPSIKDEITLGNANTQHLGEIWNGKPANDLRAALKDRSAFKTNPCKTCPSHESFKGFKSQWGS